MAFRAQKTVVTLEPDSIIRLQEILMDDDQQGALEFLREVIGEKIQCAQDETHKPEFEGGVRLQETHLRSRGVGHREPEEKS